MSNANLEISRVLCDHRGIGDFRFNFLKDETELNFIG